MKTLKISILLLALLAFKFQVSLNAQKLSENAQISLLTCNPGTDLYSVFGHSAIRVKDYDKGIDWVYNYGTFNFKTPNFYVKFVRGQLNYQLAVNHMQDFLNEYQYENRSVYEQVLDLSQDEKEEVFNFLEFNRLPENMHYLYDFFFDNCATRVRDVFQKEMTNRIKFDEGAYKQLSFRQMLKPYLEPQPWSRFGINLVLGAIADREATLDESMFLPDYMKVAFAGAQLSNKPLVKSSKTLFEQQIIEEKISFFERPGFVFWSVLIFVFLITFLEIRNKKAYKLIDFIVFLFVGVIGLIIFLLWFATDHTAVVNNWNLLWAIPTHFFIAFLVFRKSKSNFLKYYFLVSGILTASSLVSWFFIPQQYDLAFIPIIIMASLRSFKLFQYY
ncbi:MAG: DUF4105 domain-containing protein [Bacteroidales bacterium]|nr:DUF4105 domain-containing protein [Bacteroidales bacterium]